MSSKFFITVVPPEPTTDDSFHHYDGPMVDTASIILSILCALSFCLCCFIKYCYDEFGFVSEQKSEYNQTSQQDIDDETNDTKDAHNKNCDGCYYFVTLLPWILLFGLGLNLLFRYNAGHCTFDQDAKCGNNR